MNAKTRTQKIRIAAARMAAIRAKYGLAKFLPDVRADLQPQAPQASEAAGHDDVALGRKSDSDKKSR